MTDTNKRNPDKKMPMCFLVKRDITLSDTSEEMS